VTQTPLFIESVYDALTSAVKVAGGPKHVGSLLFPGKPVDDARSMLLNALDPSRREKLDPEQVIYILRLARDAGYHDAKHWLDLELGYAATPPVDANDQAAELARVIAGAGEQLRRATDALERLQGRKARR
jgi:hypothetical protein